MYEQTDDIKTKSLSKVSPMGGDLEGAVPGSNPGSVLCFGEVMLRLSPPADTSWLKQHHVHVNLAGAECNVAVALAKWGVPVKYCTALPGSSVTASILAFLNEKGIDTNPVKLCGSRVGLLYIQQGMDLKQGGVIYDRKYSSFGELQPGTIDWDAVLQGVSWFHFSAINPALGENVVDVCLEALAAARSRGITISVDLNYRAKLWQYGKQPVEVMPQLAACCDVIMGNIWSSNILLGTPLHEDLIAAGTKEAYLQHARLTGEAIAEKFPTCKTVACTFRFDTQPAGILYYGSLFTGKTLFSSGDFTANAIIDKVGSGDCFMAALIFALRNGYTPPEVIEFAAAAAFGKLHEKGDFTDHSVDNVKNIITHHAYSI
jgi:2-dehydro-3-deoxygluconokinase